MAFLFSLVTAEGQTKKEYTIPFEKNASGVLEVDARVNGIPRRFIYDTGASMISIDRTFYQALYDNGYISNSDISGETDTWLADGRKAKALIILIRDLKVGDLALTDVEALVIDGNDVPFLMGQNAFADFGYVAVDYDNNRIVIKSSVNTRTVRLNEIRLVPCSEYSLRETAKIRSFLLSSRNLQVSDVTQEDNVPPPKKALDRIRNKITIRFFDNDDKQKALSLKKRFEEKGYLSAAVDIENMVPYFRKPIPDYVEIWVR